MKLFSNKHAKRLIALLVADIMFFGLTNSASVPSIMMIIGFLLLVGSLYYGMYGLVYILTLYGLPIKRKRHVAMYMTAVTGFLLALQSIGELSTRDILVLTPLAALGYMYTSYAKNNRRNLTA